MPPIHIDLPASESDIRELRAGDEVSISGLVHTGRDRFHKHLSEGNASPVDLRGGAIYHCGPVTVRGDDGAWKVVAAGPTTSARENPYMAEIIRREGLRAVIGKGGMDENTALACKQHGCVYLQAVGGAAALLAHCVKRVVGVSFFKEFGATEACWSLEVVDFPALVGIDAAGNSLFEKVRASSRNALERLLA